METSASDRELWETLAYNLVPAVHCILHESNSESYVGHLKNLLDFLECLEERFELPEDDLALIPLRVWDRYLSNEEKILFSAGLKQINEINAIEEDDD